MQAAKDINVSGSTALFNPFLSNTQDPSPVLDSNLIEATPFLPDVTPPIVDIYPNVSLESRKVDITTPSQSAIKSKTITREKELNNVNLIYNNSTDNKSINNKVDLFHVEEQQHNPTFSQTSNAQFSSPIVTQISSECKVIEKDTFGTSSPVLSHSSQVFQAQNTFQQLSMSNVSPEIQVIHSENTYELQLIEPQKTQADLFDITENVLTDVIKPKTAPPPRPPPPAVKPAPVLIPDVPAPVMGDLSEMITMSDSTAPTMVNPAVAMPVLPVKPENQLTGD